MRLDLSGQGELRANSPGARYSQGSSWPGIPGQGKQSAVQTPDVGLRNEHPIVSIRHDLRDTPVSRADHREPAGCGFHHHVRNPFHIAVFSATRAVHQDIGPGIMVPHPHGVSGRCHLQRIRDTVALRAKAKCFHITGANHAQLAREARPTQGRDRGDRVRVPLLFHQTPNHQEAQWISLGPARTILLREELDIGAAPDHEDPLVFDTLALQDLCQGFGNTNA